MKNLIISILAIVVAFLGTVSPTVAQENIIPDERIAIVHLKSGSKVEGEIIDWKIGEYIRLKLPWGQEHTFLENHIKKVIQKSTLNSKTRAVHDYVFKQEGLYISPRIHTIAGNAGNRANGVWGLGGSISAGHRFNRLLSVGAGFGYDRYIWRSGENFLPVFAEISGFFMPSNRSFFYNLQLGYAFAFTDEEYLLNEARGGYMVYPNVGYSWGLNETKLGLSLGYKFQDAKLTYANAWNFGERYEQDLLYKRLCFSFSLWY